MVSSNLEESESVGASNGMETKVRTEPIVAPIINSPDDERSGNTAPGKLVTPEECTRPELDSLGAQILDLKSRLDLLMSRFENGPAQDPKENEHAP